MTPGRVILSESQFLSCSQAQNQCGNQSRSQKDGDRNPGFPTKEGQTAERGVDLEPVGLLTGTAAHGRDNPTAVPPQTGCTRPAGRAAPGAECRASPVRALLFPKLTTQASASLGGGARKSPWLRRAHVNAAQSARKLSCGSKTPPRPRGSPADRRRQQTGTQVLPWGGVRGTRPPGRGGQAHPAVPACARSAVRVHVLVCQGHSGMFV